MHARRLALDNRAAGNKQVLVDGNCPFNSVQIMARYMYHDCPRIYDMEMCDLAFAISEARRKVISASQRTTDLYARDVYTKASIGLGRHLRGAVGTFREDTDGAEAAVCSGRQ